MSSFTGCPGEFHCFHPPLFAPIVKNGFPSATIFPLSVGFFCAEKAPAATDPSASAIPSAKHFVAFWEPLRSSLPIIRFLGQNPLPTGLTLALFWLILGIYPVAAVDFEYKLIPDSISIGGIVVGLSLSFFPGGITPAESLFGTLLAGGGLYLIGFIAGKILKRDAMGLGDVKLLAGFGALMGFEKAFAVLVLASFIGILVMLPYRALQKKVGKEIPFGPFLALAAPIVYRFGDLFFVYYFGLFGIPV